MFLERSNSDRNRSCRPSKMKTFSFGIICPIRNLPILRYIFLAGKAVIFIASGVISVAGRTVCQPGISIPAAGRIVCQPGISIPAAGRTICQPGISIPAAGRTVWQPGISIPAAGRTVCQPGISILAAGRTVWQPGISIPAAGRVVPVVTYRIVLVDGSCLAGVLLSCKAIP